MFYVRTYTRIQYVMMAPESFLYSCKCCTSVNSSFSTVTLVMIGGFVIASISLQQCIVVKAKKGWVFSGLLLDIDVERGEEERFEV